MKTNHEKIKEHVKKYNRIYLCYFLAYIVVIALALLLDAPILLIPLLPLVIIHILTRCVDVAEMDILTNEQLFCKELKDRHND